MSINLSLWGLGEAKRLLVIALPLWDPQWIRSFLRGSELRIKSLVSFACLSSLQFAKTLELVCARSIYSLLSYHICGCRRFLASKLNI
jgi:hypothetical protein